MYHNMVIQLYTTKYHKLYQHYWQQFTNWKLLTYSLELITILWYIRHISS